MRVFAALLTSVILYTAAAEAGITVDGAWARPALKGEHKTSAIYMRLMNEGQQPVALIKASSPLAKDVQLHKTSQEGDVMKMRQVEKIVCEPETTTELKPGSFHIMLINLNQDLAVQDPDNHESAEGNLVKTPVVPLMLQFDNGENLTLEVPVKKGECCGSCHEH